ncbi:MAG TPA: MarR family transcriptional regulator [Pseudonocardia sp.]|nr:MarR family transcriptional regulator [Pseudonocardia sp.]
MSDRSAELAAEIVGPLARRNSTATVLFHHAVAERLGLGPSDHKCLDLVRERGPLTAAELAALTGLSTGAITGVVGRLERAGFLRREPDPHDGRKQILSMTAEADDRLGSVFAGLTERTYELLDGFDEDQLATVAEFLRRATDFAHRRTALLRAQTLVDGPRRPHPAGRTASAPIREDPP